MKKIAIIGAGLSGLSCAWRLEQLGFDGQIDLFEKKAEISGGNPFAEFVSELFHRPIDNVIDYLAEHYNLSLTPAQTVTGSINYGPTATAQISGFLGQSFTRGTHDLSLVQQLYDKIKTRAILNSSVQLEDIRSDYDFVVLATGRVTDVPKEVPVRIDRYCHFLHTVARGEFEPNIVQLVLNQDFAKNGYGYLIPIDDTQAMLSLVTSERNFDLRRGWERFVESHWQGKLRYDTMHEIIDFPIGEPERYTHDNVLFVGNTAGAVTPAFGFGLHVAILTGLYAADSILLGKDYNELMKQHRREYQWGLGLRHAMDRLDNDMYDKIIKGMDTLIGRAVVARSRFNIMRFLGRTLSLFTRETKNSGYPFLPVQVRHYDVPEQPQTDPTVIL